MAKHGCRDSSIDVRGLSHSYGTLRVLKEVSFKVAAGEFVGIVGANGSGKTTLLNCVSGILGPTGGIIRVCGKEVRTTDSMEMARSVAIVPQESSDNFAFTVEEMVLMGRYAHIERFSFEEERDHEAAEHAMKATGTWKLRERSVTELSGGEKRRVIIARALAQEPRVMLLDEPTSHLDLRHQLEILGLIREQNGRKGLTVLAVFHDLNLAARFCDRLLIMDSGRITASGAPGEVLTRENIAHAFRVDANVATNAAGRVVVDVGDIT